MAAMLLGSRHEEKRACAGTIRDLVAGVLAFMLVMQWVCTSVRQRGLTSVFTSQRVFFLFYCQSGPEVPQSKQQWHTRTSAAAGRRRAALVCAAVLSSPVSCQNRKKGGVKRRGRG